MQVVNLFLAVAAGIVALIALWVALHQVRLARRVAELQADLSLLQSLLAMELAGKRDEAFMTEWARRIMDRAQKLGSRDLIDEVEGVLKSSQSD